MSRHDSPASQSRAEGNRKPETLNSPPIQVGCKPKGSEVETYVRNQIFHRLTDKSSLVKRGLFTRRWGVLWGCCFKLLKYRGDFLAKLRGETAGPLRGQTSLRAVIRDHPVLQSGPLGTRP